MAYFGLDLESGFGRCGARYTIDLLAATLRHWLASGLMLVLLLGKLKSIFMQMGFKIWHHVHSLSRNLLL